MLRRQQGQGAAVLPGQRDEVVLLPSGSAMRPFSWSPVPLAVVSAGVGYGRPTRLLADRVAEAVCRSLAAGGARAEVEVLELHRLAADLAQYSAHGRVSLDLREAIAAVVTA